MLKECQLQVVPATEKAGLEVFLLTLFFLLNFEPVFPEKQCDNNMVMNL